MYNCACVHACVCACPASSCRPTGLQSIVPKDNNGIANNIPTHRSPGNLLSTSFSTLYWEQVTHLVMFLKLEGKYLTYIPNYDGSIIDIFNSKFKYSNIKLPFKQSLPFTIYCTHTTYGCEYTLYMYPCVHYVWMNVYTTYQRLCTHNTIV